MQPGDGVDIPPVAENNHLFTVIVTIQPVFIRHRIAENNVNHDPSITV